jgi:hypothetical protein
MANLGRYRKTWKHARWNIEPNSAAWAPFAWTGTDACLHTTIAAIAPSTAELATIETPPMKCESA